MLKGTARAALYRPACRRGRWGCAAASGDEFSPPNAPAGAGAMTSRSRARFSASCREIEEQADIDHRPIYNPAF
jgi:hypothetical protein